MNEDFLMIEGSDYPLPPGLAGFLFPYCAKEPIRWLEVTKGDVNLNRHALRPNKQYWNICPKKAKIQIFDRKP